jgi:hypothetical protein
VYESIVILSYPREQGPERGVRIGAVWVGVHQIFKDRTGGDQIAFVIGFGSLPSCESAVLRLLFVTGTQRFEVEAEHGPYFSLTRTMAGTHSRYLSPEQAELARQQIEQGHKFQEQVEQYREA